MAKVKEISVGKAVLVSIGNYENVRIEASTTVSIEEGDDEETVRSKAMNGLNKYLSDEVDSIELKQRKAQSKSQRFGC